MAHTDGPHQKLSEHLRVVARGPGAERLLTRLRSAGLRIETGADLMAVLERRSESGEPDAALVECLARIAPRDELAALALLELLGRRLEAMASQLARRDDITREEAESNVLGAAWEVLARRRPSERAARLDAIWTEVRRSVGVRRMEVAGPLPEGFDVAAPEDPDPLERWPGLLDGAGVAGVLSNEEAVLIARTRVEGESLRCLARDLGRPYDAVRMERRRAEAALRSYASSLRASS